MIKKHYGLTIAVLAALLLTGCKGNADSNGSDPVQKEDGVTIEASADDAAGKDERGIVFLCNFLGDLSFSDSGWEGCQKAAEKYGWNADVIEMSQDTSLYENAFLDACDSGKYRILVTTSNYGLSDLCAKYAPDYPDMRFISYDMGIATDISGIDNMYGIAYKQNEGSYLAGALAGKITKTNKIGAFFMNDIPVGNDFMTGYLAGAKAANPDIKVSYAYLGGKVDATKTQEIVAVMFDNNVDVIYGVQASTFISLAKECTARGGVEGGYNAIGVDVDMWKTYSESENAAYADAILTSMYKDISQSVCYGVDQLMEGQADWGGKVVSLGMKENGVGLIENEFYKKHVSQDVQTYITQLKHDIVAGKIEIPSYFDFEDYNAYDEWRNSLNVLE